MAVPRVGTGDVVSSASLEIWPVRASWSIARQPGNEIAPNIQAMAPIIQPVLQET